MPKLHPWDGRVAVLSFSPVESDQRVLRQCALLRDMGSAPFVISYASADAEIGHRLARRLVPQPTAAHRLVTLACQLPAHLGPAAARAGFWTRSRNRWALSELLGARPRLVIANDWPALVVAAELKRRIGCRVHYDAHEFATLEFAESAWWRAVYMPAVRHLERAAIRAADAVSTVSEGLAAALQTLYGLPRRPDVVRNLPDLAEQPVFRPAAWPLRVLYHGNVVPLRGLEMLIESAGRWREPHTLLIRGDGRPAYLAALRALADAGPHPERVRFEPAVPAADVVAAAQKADLGVFFTPLNNIQQQYTLPNKLFEYIAAGLAVAVTPAPDMAAVIASHQLGVTSGQADVDAITNCIDALTREKVDRMRECACRAAPQLTWRAERALLANLIETHLRA